MDGFLMNRNINDNGRLVVAMSLKKYIYYFMHVYHESTIKDEL